MSPTGADPSALDDASGELRAQSRVAADHRDWFDQTARLAGLHCDPGVGGVVAAVGEEIDRVDNSCRQTSELLDAVREGLLGTRWDSLVSVFRVQRELVDLELATLGIEPDEENDVDRTVAANRILIRSDLERETDPGRRALLSSWLEEFVDPISGDVTVPQILLYDGDAGRVAVAFGDGVDADDVIVGVPGTGTTLDAYRLGADPGLEANRAQLLRLRTSDLSGTRVAVIAWLGYDAPQWVSTNNPGTSGAGERGGLQLHAFIDDLGLDDGQRLTVIGHSYGSFVVGEALGDGLHPDNTVVLGSPGMGVDHVGDLHLPRDSDVFAMRSTMDPVGTLERFGTSPTSPMFGATRLRSHTDTFAFSHSDYWDDKNLTQIALAATDGDPETTTFSSVGDVVHEATMTPLRVGDDIIDQVQRPLPWFAENVIDDTQTITRTVAGAGSTVVSHGVDMGVNAGGEAIEWTGHRLEDGAEWSGDRIGDVGEALGGLFD